MTANQTIDGVPRKLLEQLVDPVNHIGRVKARAELRALLDAPDQSSKLDTLRAEVEKWKGIAGRRTAERTEFMNERDDLKAAQPQGEPVGFRYCVHGSPWELMLESPFADGRTHYRENGEELEPVYAEQPAPVKVTLQQVLKAYEYAESHPHKYLRGTTNWCAAVAYSINTK